MKQPAHLRFVHSLCVGLPVQHVNMDDEDLVLHHISILPRKNMAPRAEVDHF